MPDQQDNERTPFNAVWEPGDKILTGIRRWSYLARRQRVDVALTAVVAICGFWVIGAAGLWLVSSALYRSPWFLFGAAAFGAGALAVLLRRQRQSRSRISKRWGLSLGLRFLVIAALLVVAGTSVLLWRYQRLSQVRFYNQLKSSGLPADLYDYQRQLESLTIQQGVLTDLDWLNATALTDLTIASRRLNSLAGLAHVPELQSLDIDLRGVPMKSLAGISALHHLRTLVLRNIGQSKAQLSSEVGSFSGLKTLDLDFERSAISSLPDLMACQELQELRLNLRATTAVAELPDLSGLHQLHSVTLFLDNSKVRSLKPLARLDHLQTLTLALDGTQLGLLKDWLSELKDSPGPESLTLFFTTPPNGNFPDFSKIHHLISLGVTMPASEPPARTPVPDVTHLDKLQQLTISVGGSEIRVLPEIARLTGLQTLDLDLLASGVQHLPDISQLRNLEQLNLDISSTAIPELPDFAQIAPQLSRLSQLNLGLANSSINSLRGIEHLSGLRTLSLDIREDTKIGDIGSIAKMGGLEKLSLRLQWSQVGALPDLAPLRNLKDLELQVDDWFGTEKLPDLSNLPNLRKLRLTLEDSQVEDLLPLEKIDGLEKLYLDLKGARLEILPNLKSLKNLTAVEVDIRHSRISLSQTQGLRSLVKLTVGKDLSSLDGLPGSVKHLIIGP